MGKGAVASALADDNFDWCSFYALFWNVRSHASLHTLTTTAGEKKQKRVVVVARPQTKVLTRASCRKKVF